MNEKTELRVVPHHVLPETLVIELWHCGRLIGTVTGADGPGVRIISKYALIPEHRDYAVNLLQVRIGA